MADQKLQEINTLYAPAFSNDWDEQSLYPLADWLNGMAFKDFEFTQNGKPVIKIAEIKNGISGQTRFTNEKYDEKYLLKKGDMLFCWSGQPQTSIDVFWWDGPEGWLNQHIFKVTSKLNNKYFFFYLLKYLKPNFVQIAINKQTTGLGHVTKADLERFVVKLPKPEEQHAIAAVLSSLDDKIELLREQNKTLEATAQAIFKEWFVNFNFPGTTGKMIDSELGKIPDGWRVGKLGELVEIKNGFAFKSEDYITVKQYPIIRTMNFEDSGYINSENLVYISNKKAEEYKNFNFDEFDLCVVMVGASLGKTALVNKINLPALQNQNMWCFKPKNKRHRFYNNFQVLDLVNLNMKSASGSARDFFRKDHFYDIDVLIPIESFILRFEEIILPIYSKISNTLSQIQTLSTLRDALLPKLMKGEIRVDGFNH